ncbi:MAG: hypothetical protein ABJR46_14025 [Tateyamaria sp.]|uniref:hypothetical protein n=1 Tax=Tateyamaria sp. TaxID=1929288 RepID=UPI0032827849
MSRQGASPVFLERRSYRRRRMMDALRVLPVVGVLLWMVPLFWPTASDGPDAPAAMAMSDAIVYVFVIWLILIGAGLALWWLLRAGADASDDLTKREDG